MLFGAWIVTVVFPLALCHLQRVEDKIRIPVQDRGEVGGASKQNNDEKGKIWAVLVAGSCNFPNYRHQADICHAYQVFRSRGVPDENIIVMMCDDIASSPDNPRPGVIINKPGGSNVYKHVPKDYTGDAVTVENFFNVITGNKSALEGVGSGKVLESGPNDHVFIMLVDKGNRGRFDFPTEMLYPDDLTKNIKVMHKEKMYKKLLIFMESSHSGSMFDSFLPSNMNAMALSACSKDQDSFATYWDDKLGVYVGDVFSCSCLEYLDSLHHKNSTIATLEDLYLYALNHALVNSTPTIYGTKRISKDHVTDFFGKGKKITDRTIGSEVSAGQFKEVVKGQDVYLLTLQKKIEKVKIPEEKRILQDKLDGLLKGRADIEDLLARIMSHLPAAERAAVSDKREALTPELFPCYKALLQMFDKLCVSIPRNPFVSRYLYWFVNICATGHLSTDQVFEAFKLECTSPSAFDNIN